jgi:hypothetical protein
VVSPADFWPFALYAGVDCRSEVHHPLVCGLPVRSRRTVIDSYLDEIDAFAFVIQFVIAIILGVVGYARASESTLMSLKTAQFDWPPTVIGTGNYLLMSLMIPVTLKVVLPLLRWVYGTGLNASQNWPRKTRLSPSHLRRTLQRILGRFDRRGQDRHTDAECSDGGAAGDR